VPSSSSSHTEPCMRLTLRPEWRLWPFSSFFGLLDLKTGVTVALLFAVRATLLSLHFGLTERHTPCQLLNKVAGVYGLIAVLTGAGGSFAQLSLYVYSAVALVALGWGLRAVKEVRMINLSFLSCTDREAFRKMRGTHSTLPTCSSPTISSPPFGQCFSE
jgi:inositol phosphorylceramide synthase regulatory subunit